MQLKVPPPPKMDDAAFDYLWHALEATQEQIRFSDTKAGAIAVVNGTIFTIALGAANALSGLIARLPWMVWPVMVCSVLLILSTYFALRCLMPRIRFPKKGNLPASHIFFQDVAEQFNTAAEYERSVVAMLEHPEAARTEVTGQIWANSRIAAAKYRNVRQATLCLSIAILGVLGLVVIGLVG